MGIKRQSWVSRPADRQRRMADAIDNRLQPIMGTLLHTNESRTLRRAVRIALGLFMFGLVVSGLTAFPLQRETERLVTIRGLENTSSAHVEPGFDRWILTVRDGLRDTYADYPWIAYGTDWLAFGHIVIALFFVGPFMDPVRNIWVLRAGVVACVLVIPLALICGSIRQIPWGWRWIDCSFGLIGVVPLLYCLKLTNSLQTEPSSTR